MKKELFITDKTSSSYRQEGLYDAANEHDACGVGMIVNIHGNKSHELVDAALKVLENMKSAHISSGLVCDEYGSCIGIITLTDILESIVGNVPEPVEEEPYIIERKDGDGWFVDGQCPMYDFLSYFGEENLLDDEDYNTVGGLCLYQLDHVPGSGETFVWEKFKFEVVDMDGARIDKLLVKRVDEPEKTAED